VGNRIGGMIENVNSLALRVVVPPEFPPAEDGAPWLQFMMTEPVTDEAPDEQVRALVERITGSDPRVAADVCGGSRESAEPRRKRR